MTLDQQYWDTQYKTEATGWDLNEVSPPLKKYIDQLTDKNISILIPGAGNAYEAAYLLQVGFTDITVVDIAPSLVMKLRMRYKSNPHIKIVQADFFMHEGKYDLVIEQTFFCAIRPVMRQKYVAKMYELLNPDGRLVGLLFNRDFENNPPFGGSKAEYEKLFFGAFEYKTFELCYNSVKPRRGTELFINFKKRLKAPPLQIEKLITERLILIPFTVDICRNILNGDFKDISDRGLKKGKGWPDNDVMETLPRIINNLSQVESPTGFESWMIVKSDTLEIIGDAGFKGFNYEQGNADIGYGIIKEERRNGYAEEAATTLIKWAFATRLVKEITARCITDNISSVNLLKKLDFIETKRENEMTYWLVCNKE